MGRLTVEADWVRELGDLVAGSDRPVLDPSLPAWNLLRLARQHAFVCGGATCLLRDLPGGPEACVLALELSLVAVDGELSGPGHAPDVTKHYFAALQGAASVVSHCRRVEHASGHCWFADDSGRDLCGRVLVVSHLVGA